ncbi:Uncharacterized conserved protein, DUF305 family [Micromonospora pattaloongensis]|uniref:Uncharacterized conserved protein, DUF305 family n=1 Tax=Micromonospora pattaloongensis TaxID=405436 RepID=A0A1H3LUF1_9ACTN|nr:DUF305 domain-containing protein [Micromonospora pattaloongensis]SDY67608.1 Uncharacterized conserved protein, DUF305 family [Micromonospora pattaloongensis]
MTTSAQADPDTPRPSRPARRYGTLAVALAIVVGLLLGYAGGLLTPRLTRPGDASVEAGFARDMSSHHAQAVEMGLIAFRSSSDPAVRQLAVDIATGQQGEIGMMQSWLREWGLGPNRSGPPMAWMSDGAATMKDGLMPGMATPQELERLRTTQGRDHDVLFLELMIKHHLGGVHMVDAIVEHGAESEVIEAATRMKNTQQGELTNMNNLLARLKGAPASAEAPQPHHSN